MSLLDFLQRRHVTFPSKISEYPLCVTYSTVYLVFTSYSWRLGCWHCLLMSLSACLKCLLPIVEVEVVFSVFCSRRWSYCTFASWSCMLLFGQLIAVFIQKPSILPLFIGSSPSFFHYSSERRSLCTGRLCIDRSQGAVVILFGLAALFARVSQSHSSPLSPPLLGCCLAPTAITQVTVPILFSRACGPWENTFL